MIVDFVRHGETQWNKERRLQGDSDIPLNDKGIELAFVTAKKLKEEGFVFDHAFTSPLVRASKTCEILLDGSGLKPQPDQRLKEICFGGYEGMRFDELKEAVGEDALAPFFNDPANYVAKNGAEDIPHLLTRLKSFWEEEILPLEGKCDRVLVACHGAVCRGFLVLLKPYPIAEFWGNHQFNCAVNEVKVIDGKPEVLWENRIFYDPSLVTFIPKKIADGEA